jgi:hypothetical protein|eukprot:COSAG01_NODE_7505_length_3177_cov_3.303345_6_plen_56_part_00
MFRMSGATDSLFPPGLQANRLIIRKRALPGARFRFLLGFTAVSEPFCAAHVIFQL